MASTFPTSIDNFTDPLSTSPLNSPSHSAQHANLNDAVEKIETYALNLPKGYLDGVKGTAATAIVAATNLSVLSKSITITAGRRYRIHGSLGFQPSANSTGNFLWVGVTSVIQKFLWGRADQILANYPQYVGGSYITTATDLGVTSGSSAITFTLWLRCGGNGALNTNPDAIVGANSADQLLWIEDIGI